MANVAHTKGFARIPFRNGSGNDDPEWVNLKHVVAVKADTTTISSVTYWGVQGSDDLTLQTRQVNATPEEILGIDT